MKAVIDLVLLGILILCTWSGYKKGILMGVGGIVAIVVSIYGANLLANVFSYDVVPALKPFASGYTDRLLTGEDGKVMKELGWENYNYSVEDLLQRYPDRRGEFSQTCYEALGIDSVTAASMAERSVTYARESGVGMKDAMVQILCESVGYVACFLLAFLILIIILTVIGNLPNLSYKIPGMDIVNNIGGAVLGLVTGILFCVLLVWALKFMGMIFRNGALSSSILGGLLLRKDFLFRYLNI
ncbi:MAG: CvpA family protein [Oscillospiraceae bacterium]|nr:CvpA family protein [Oscillospiraceae bacterium]